MDNKQEFVVHPNHYNQCKFECWDVFEDILKVKRYNCAIGAYMANAFKYIWRCGSKAGDYGKNQIEKNIEDIKKAIQYIDRAINVIYKEDEKSEKDTLETVYKYNIKEVLSELLKNKKENIGTEMGERLNHCLSLLWTAGDSCNNTKANFLAAKKSLEQILVDFKNLN